MRTLNDIISRLAKAKPDLARRFGVRRLAVFGSYARGDQREDSDVDVPVEVDPSKGLRFVDLAEEIEAILGVRTELVSHRALKQRHQEVIKKDLIEVP